MSAADAPTTSGDWTSATSTTGTALVGTKPTNTAVGDVLVAWTTSQTTGGTITSPGAGWSRAFTASAASARAFAIDVLTVPDSATLAALPASWTWSKNSGQRADIIIQRVFNSYLASVLDAAGVDVYSATTGQTGIVVPGATATYANSLALVGCYVNTTSTTQLFTPSAGGGYTTVGDVQSPTGSSVTALHVQKKQLSASGPVASETVGINPSASATGGVMLLFRSATTPVTASRQTTWGVASSMTSVTSSRSTTWAVSTPISTWLANTPLYAGHRMLDNEGFGEMTTAAFAYAVRFEPRLAGELSVRRTSDGVWVLSHDSSTVRLFGVDIDIASNPWSAISGLRTTVGGYAMVKLTDALNAYATGDQVFFVDNKADANVAEFLDLLDPYGGSSRFIIKGYYTQSNTPTAARARGYQTLWGYCYTADLPNLGAVQSRWSILGIEFNASPSSWANVNSYNKPTLAHSCTSVSDNNTGLAVANGIMTGKATGTVASSVTSITASRSTAWSANAAASGSRITNWAVLNSATALRSTAWGVFSQVTGGRSTGWSAFVAATSSRSAFWASLARSSASRSGSWGVNSQISAGAATAWLTLATVAANRMTSWSCKAAVSAVRSTIWNVASQVQPVTGTRVTRWTSSALTTSARIAAWGVLVDRRMAVQRAITQSFIDALPVTIALVPHVKIKTSTGGSVLQAGEPKPPQTMTLIEPAQPNAAQLTQDGVQKETVFQLLGPWNADIEVGDRFDANGRHWTVTRLYFYNGWERRAEVVVHDAN